MKKYALLMLLVVFSPSCGYDFMEPEADNRRLEIEVDTICNEYDITIKI